MNKTLEQLRAELSELIKAKVKAEPWADKGFWAGVLAEAWDTVESLEDEIAELEQDHD